MIINKILTKCSICGISLSVGSGFAFRDKDSNNWIPVCDGKQCVSLACPEEMQSYLRHMEKIKVRKLTSNGEILMNYDRESKPLIESFPGARYNKETKTYFVSLDLVDRPRVIEIANQLKLDIDPSLLVFELNKSTKDALKRAKKTTAFPFQMEGIKWLASQENCLLADDMGLGKTIMLLLSFDSRYGHLIVVPSHVKLTWKDETEKWRPDLKVSIMKNGKQFKYPEPGEVFITTYGLLPWWLELEKGKRKNPMITEEEIEAGKDVVLVFDEVQALKSNKTKQHKKAKQLRKIVKRTIGTTGTPIMNRPLELWNILSVLGIEKKVFDSFPNFIRLFRGSKTRFGYQFSDIGPREEVPELLRRAMLRRKKKDVDIQLPDKMYKEIYVDTPNKIKRELDNVWDLYRSSTYYDNEELPPLEKISKTKKELAESKIPALKELVEDLEEKGIIPIVFSAHVKPVKEIGKRKGWAYITGESEFTPEKKHKIAKQFQNGELKGLAATIKAAGTGLTLTKAHYAIFNDQDYVPSNNSQAEDRLVRISATTNKAIFYHLIADHPLDRHIHKLIFKKMKLFESALDKRIKVNIDVEDRINETLEDFEIRKKNVEKNEKQKVEEAIRSRLPFWMSGTKIDEKKKISKKNAIKLKKEAEDILKKSGTKIRRGKKEISLGFDTNDARIVRLLLLGGAESQDELRLLDALIAQNQKKAS